MLLQTALNGARSQADHAAVPVTIDELCRDALACVRAGADAIHLHPRDEHGAETLDPAVVNEVVAAVRAACGVPVGVGTGAWIEPDVTRRVAAVREWNAPDYASVNLSEEGADDVIEALLEVRIGIEAGVWSVEDARHLARSPARDGLTRVLIEMIDLPTNIALARSGEIGAVLDWSDITAPRLQHGEGEPAWPVLADAIDRGLDIRIGFEDTLTGPHGAPVAGNAALVRAAALLAARSRSGL